jgi:CheY-like chemotaxis protein
MPTVLLVEDNRLARTTSQHLLNKAGFKVLVAEDGEEGLLMARTTGPDVILLDLLLPILSGEKVLQAIKQDPRTIDIPVIVLTALSQKNEKKLIEEGAFAFLEKTKVMDNPQVLLRILERILRRHGRLSAVPLTDAAV